MKILNKIFILNSFFAISGVSAASTALDQIIEEPPLPETVEDTLETISEFPEIELPAPPVPEYDFIFENLDKSIELKVLLETAKGLQRLDRIKIEDMEYDLQNLSEEVRLQALESLAKSEELKKLNLKGLSGDNKLNESESKTIQKAFYVPQIKKISIENKYGDITVRGYDGDSLEVQAVIIVKSTSREKALNALDRLDLKMKKWGNTFKIQTISNGSTKLAPRDKEKEREARGNKRSFNMSPLAFLDKKSYTVDITIKMPKGKTVIIENKYGDINIEETDGLVEIDNYNGDIAVFESKSVEIQIKYGDTEIESIDGDVEVDYYNGDLRVKDVDGSLTGDGKYADVYIDNIKEAVNIINYMGKIDLRDIQKSSSIESKYGDIKVSNVAGNLAVDNYNGNLIIEEIEGTLIINSKYGNLDISQINKGVNIINYNGDIELNNLADSVYVNNKYGKITATEIGKDLNFSNYNGNIKLESIGGFIKTNITYGNLDISSAAPRIKAYIYNGDVKIKKIIGGNPDIHIESKYGKVKLEIPFESSAKFDLQTKSGNIIQKIAPGKISSKNGIKSMQGLIGSGQGTIIIKGDNTDIYLKN